MGLRVEVRVDPESLKGDYRGALGQVVYIDENEKVVYSRKAEEQEALDEIRHQEICDLLVDIHTAICYLKSGD